MVPVLDELVSYASLNKNLKQKYSWKKKIENRHWMKNRIEALLPPLGGPVWVLHVPERREREMEGDRGRARDRERDGGGGWRRERERQPNQTCLGVVSCYCVKWCPLKYRNYSPIWFPSWLKDCIVGQNMSHSVFSEGRRKSSNSALEDF